MKIKKIFEDTLQSLNLTITDTQKEPIFNFINRKFFSNVTPISHISLEDFNEKNVVGSDILDFIIDKETDSVTIYTKPNDYTIYEISHSYYDAYQTLCEAILEKFESYNLSKIKGLGVEDIDTKLELSYADIDATLFKKFAFSKPQLII